VYFNEIPILLGLIVYTLGVPALPYKLRFAPEW